MTDVADKHDAFAASAAALTKSGTSTLELAMAGVPMVVTYRVNPLTAAIARRLVTVPYAALVNLLAEREVVPELIQAGVHARAAGRRGARAAGRSCGSVGAARRFRDVLRSCVRRSGLPSDAAADVVLELLDQS